MLHPTLIGRPIIWFIYADWHKTQTKYRSKSQPILGKIDKDKDIDREMREERDWAWQNKCLGHIEGYQTCKNYRGQLNVTMSSIKIVGCWYIYFVKIYCHHLKSFIAYKSIGNPTIKIKWHKFK